MTTFLNKLSSWTSLLVALCFFVGISLSACGGGDSSAADESEAVEETAEAEGEHPEGEEGEHPEGDGEEESSEGN